MVLTLNSELITETYVMSRDNKNWGIGQIQSSIENIIAVNFENVGKKVTNIKEVHLEIIKA